MNHITEDKFGGGNSPSELITLQNSNGLIAQFTPYGARWVSMWVPDSKGQLADIVLGFDSLSGYHTAGERYHGAIVGRVCGRISNARFAIGTEEYRLASNDVYGKPIPNHLHGGIQAFHNRIWESRLVQNSEGEQSAVFTCFSKDREEGYPGNMEIIVTYSLRSDNVLSMTCEATCDKWTPVNLTNHAFFNLSGVSSGMSTLSHTLHIASSRIIECDEQLIPTGSFIPVEDTPLDFKTPRKLEDSLRSDLFQIKENNGFSLAFALDDAGMELPKSAELIDKASGRRLTLYTNQPSLQVYTGYFMDGNDKGKNNIPYLANAGIALEPQGYPDAVNHPEFPSVLLAPGRIYCHKTEYRFSTL